LTNISFKNALFCEVKESMLSFTVAFSFTYTNTKVGS
jgi:hypothetical protein